MTMIDQDNYTAVVEAMDAHPDWEYSGTDEEYEEELDEGTGLFYDHTETDGTLLIEPDAGRVVGRLSHLLDRGLIEGEDGPFTDSLADAYAQIREEHETEYTSFPANDLVQDQYGFIVSGDYDQEEVERTIDAASAASQDIRDLHDDILATLER